MTSGVPTGDSLTTVAEMHLELQDYVEVLMGHLPPPMENGILTLMEVANAYYSRAKEIEMLILAGERDEVIDKGSPLYRFRTGELRSFIELAKGAAELGSRRLTDARRESEMRHG